VFRAFCIDVRRQAVGFAAVSVALGLACTGAYAADGRKVIRLPVQSSEKDFDCQVESDELTGTLCDNIFDTLLQYDHLARPVKLQPRAAVSMPEVSADGKTYTFKIKPGITFTAHPAFGGKKRELVAADYVYSWKRMLDPKLKSKWQFLLDGKLVDADPLVEDAKKSGKFDYDHSISGLSSPDKYTLVLRLTAPDYNLPYILAMPATAAFAREVVEYHGVAIGEHPIGTGPFKLKEWRRSSRIVLEANPDFRETYFDTAGSDDPLDQPIIAHLKGKRIPLIGRIEIAPIEEEQPRWLAYLNGDYDYIRPIPTPFIESAMPGGKLAPNLARIGMTSRPDEVAWLTYTTFNMKDKTIGGYTPEKIALRRAISMAYPVEDEIAIVEKNQAIKAYSPIAEGMAGFVRERTSTLDYNPAAAKALLDMFGYIDRNGDGFREMPDGTPLVVDQATTPDQRARSRNELWARAMERIGVRMTFNKVEKLPELRRQAQEGLVQMFTYGWIADYPDGENFLQLFTTVSIGGANYSLFSLPEYDALYEKIKFMPDTPERTALYQRMVRLLWVYSPWRVNHLKRGTILIQPWVIGFKKHPFAHEPLRYLDVDLDKLAAARKQR
jgi:oligopeptide transport system substrate-binding protein